MKGKKIIFCIICLVAILSIIIAFGVSQKDNTKDKANKENQNNMQIELQEGSKIDVKNLENAKIENGMKVNNSPKAQEEKIVENLKYSEFSMDSKNGESNFRVRVTNVGKEKTDEQYVKVTCLDVNGKSIGEIYLYLGLFFLTFLLILLCFHSFLVTSFLKLVFFLVAVPLL